MRHGIALAVLSIAILSSSLLRSQPPAPCLTRELSIQNDGNGGSVAGGGKLGYDYVLTNRGRRACTLFGYPTAVALDKDGKIVREVPFQRMAGWVGGPENQKVRAVRLKPGAQAMFQVMGYDGMGADPVPVCNQVTQIRITPPGNHRPFAPMQDFRTCSGFAAQVSFIVPASP